MNAVQKWLKDADPVVVEPPPSPDDVRRMRHLVTATAEQQPRTLILPRVPGWAAATLAVALASGFVASRWRETPGTAGRVIQGVQERAPEQEEASTRRQLQFATPGGTRVIWTFNSEFTP